MVKNPKKKISCLSWCFHMESPFFQSHSSFHMPFCLLPFMFYLFLSTFCHLPFIFYLFTFYLLNFTFYILPCTLSPGPWTLYLVPFALYRIPSKLSKIILPTVRIMRISNVITSIYIQIADMTKFC